MLPFQYPRWLEEMRFTEAEPRILKALGQEPMTVSELSHTLFMRLGLVRFTIGQLRKAGHTIENRGARDGVRGTYHLIEGKN